MRGDKIKELREKHGYSRKELADRLYVTAAEVQSWEEGWFITCPSSGEIEEMANAFEMDEDRLREIIDQDESDDSDENTNLRIIDYVDAGIRARRFIKKLKR